MTLSLCDNFATLSIATPQPYSCTFLCGATFTNSLYWRQHEVSSHRQAEIWRCSLPPSSTSATTTIRKTSPSSPSGTPACAEIFFMLHVFTEHLQSAHGIASTVAIEPDTDYPDDAGGVTSAGQEQPYDTERDHVYGGGQRNFWCGFCVGPVALANKGVEAWAERLDHIEGHLGMGEKVEEGGWVGLDGVES